MYEFLPFSQLAVYSDYSQNLISCFFLSQDLPLQKILWKFLCNISYNSAEIVANQQTSAISTNLAEMFIHSFIHSYSEKWRSLHFLSYHFNLLCWQPILNKVLCALWCDLAVSVTCSLCCAMHGNAVEAKGYCTHGTLYVQIALNVMWIRQHYLPQTFSAQIWLYKSQKVREDCPWSTQGERNYKASRSVLWHCSLCCSWPVKIKPAPNSEVTLEKKAG